MKKREHFSRRLKRVMTDRITVVAIVLIVVGIVLIQLSYNYEDVYVTPNVTNLSAPVAGTSETSVQFYQHYNLTEDIHFAMPSGEKVNYLITQYNVYTTPNGAVVHQYIYVSNGTASNGTTVHMSRMPYLQGQTFSLNMTSVSGNTFVVHISAVQNVSIVEHSAKNLGGPGIIILIIGAVLLAYSMTRIIDGGAEARASY